MMTNGEHDELWKSGAEALPNIYKALNMANAIACIKELYTMGEVSQEGYKKYWNHF